MNQAQSSPLDNPMTCEEFQDRMPELFDSANNQVDLEHLKTCENCAALVRDLQAIVDAAKLMWPIHDPSPSVWENIQGSLKADAVPPVPSPSPIPDALTNLEAGRAKLKEIPPTGRVR